MLSPILLVSKAIGEAEFVNALMQLHAFLTLYIAMYEFVSLTYFDFHFIPIN